MSDGTQSCFWKDDRSVLSRLFDEPGESDRIAAQVAALGERPSTVAYCSFESRFARSGGLAAVTMALPPYLREAGFGRPDLREPWDRRVLLVSPFHRLLRPFASARRQGILPAAPEFKVAFDGRRVPVKIYTYHSVYTKPHKGSIYEIYIESEGFFEAVNHLDDPYLYDLHNDQKNNDLGLRDAIFFCKVVPLCLEKLGLTRGILLHTQEWHTSLLAYTVKEALAEGRLGPAAVVQTLHNTFDSCVDGQLFNWRLSNLTDHPRRKKALMDRSDSLARGALQSVLNISLPLGDGPVTTVSTEFARDMTTDPVQTQQFARHIQVLLKDTLGVNNGPFAPAPPAIAPMLRLIGEGGRLEKQALGEFKWSARRALLAVLDEYRPPERIGGLSWTGEGDLELGAGSLPDEVPLFCMTGRLDPAQKGYDILLRAILRLGLEERAKFILAPMPIRESDLDLFRDVAARCRGNVVIYPMRMDRGFREIKMGSSFAVWPSIFEPFGGAIEDLMHGTPVIARATGGLSLQVEDGRSGLLYREGSRPDDKDLNRFFESGPKASARGELRWTQDMVESLLEALERAITVWQRFCRGNETYLDWMEAGLKKATLFDWHKSAADYFEVYRRASRL